ncbi:MAG: bifunctional DNA-formamidopyrimidine glycosylase/DNA-(apurinic or apyrimidinic site) lyase [Chloroflexi bacterium]|nr:bifunctional DNA-formamidopyrimidine glycosylase/DNA-(apurinic or apyrimidinic site) lyase [Chloroflexota bacterium]
MPELPEVETIAQGLREPLVGRQFTGVHVGWADLIARPAVEELKRRLVGQRILDVQRRGKYLVFALSSGASLIVHLRMTGRLLIKNSGAELDKHDHLILVLDDGRELRFNEMRKLGRVYLVDDEDEIVGDLGPEPLDDDFTAADFAALLSTRRGMIKPLLLNQRFMAGVGNIYADEALFAARIHPERRADTLTAEEIERLYHAIRQVLRQGIENRGTTLTAYRDVEGREGVNQEYLQVSRRTDEPCLRCGTPIERTVVGGRGTYFCPKCQKPALEVGG